MKISLDHDLMLLQVDDIHQIVLIKIQHIVFHNQNHKYLKEAKEKKIFFSIKEGERNNLLV